MRERYALRSVQAERPCLGPFCKLRDPAVIECLGHAGFDFCVIVQIEGHRAVDEMDAILAVPGIDVVFVGPYDLSQSLDLTGQVDHPLVVETTRQVMDTCRVRGIQAGLFVEDAAAAERWALVGAHYLCYKVDVDLLLDGCRSPTPSALLHPPGSPP